MQQSFLFTSWDVYQSLNRDTQWRLQKLSFVIEIVLGILMIAYSAVLIVLASYYGSRYLNSGGNTSFYFEQMYQREIAINGSFLPFLM